MYSSRVKRLFVLGTFGIYCFIYPSSLFLLMTDSVPAGTEWMASFMLILQGLTATGWVVINCGLGRGLTAAAAMLAGAFAVEAIGVATGLPFGQYYYTDQLAPQLAHVPVGIMFAWLMVILSASFTARFLVERLLPRARLITIAALGAALAVLSDFMMEPVAVHIQNYWVWQENGGYYGVPWSNFAAWGAISLGLGLLLARLTRTNRQNPTLKPLTRYSYGFMPMALYGMNLLFFTGINLSHQNYLAAIIGFTLGLLLAGLLVWAYIQGRVALAFLSAYSPNQPAD